MLQPRCYNICCAMMILIVIVADVLSAQARRATTNTFGRHHTSAARRVGLLQHNAPFLVPQTMSRYSRSLLLLTDERLRGGSDVDSDNSSDDDSSSSDGVGSDAEDEEENAQDDADTSQDESMTSKTAAAVPSEPVSVTIKTATGSKLLDQSIELMTVSRNRNVASLKQSVSRQLPARPPIAAIQLTWNGKVLKDDVLVEDLVEDEDEGEDDDEEEGSGSVARLVLQLDMIPAVDPKFVADLEQKIPDMTAAELLEAYAINEAAVYENSALLMQEAETGVDDNNDAEEGVEPVVRPPPVSVSFLIREQAARIRHNLEGSLLQNAHAQQILADPQPPSVKQQQAQQIVEVKGHRVRRVGTAGVKSSWKRVIQQNMNVDWSVTIRHFCLFLFFGWFGGRTPVSRAILLLGAPAVFVLQARPVKFFLRQAWYTVFDHPPGILLSLLPAPQQKILSLNVKKEMQDVYGDHIADTAPREEIEDDKDEDDFDFLSMEEDDSHSSLNDSDYDSDEEEDSSYFDE